MKGMLDLLERAGIVRRVDEGTAGADAASAAADDGGWAGPPPVPAPGAPAAAAPQAATPAAASGVAIALDQVYAQAGVPPCVYPAERLLRLLDGLKAMDEATRRSTIHAIDAADDSWSIDDPMRDAAAKVAALEQHSAGIRAAVAQAEQQTQSELLALQQRQETTVAEIRRQIADLEGLLAREIERGAHGAAALESALASERQHAQQDLDSLTRTAAALSGLITQFGTPNTTK